MRIGGRVQESDKFWKEVWMLGRRVEAVIAGTWARTEDKGHIVSGAEK